MKVGVIATFQSFPEIGRAIVMSEVTPASLGKERVNYKRDFSRVCFCERHPDYRVQTGRIEY